MLKVVRGAKFIEVTPVMELGGGKVKTSPPIAISGRQPASNTIWKNTICKEQQTVD